MCFKHYCTVSGIGTTACLYLSIWPHCLSGPTELCGIFLILCGDANYAANCAILCGIAQYFTSAKIENEREKLSYGTAWVRWDAHSIWLTSRGIFFGIPSVGFYTEKYLHWLYRDSSLALFNTLTTLQYSCVSQNIFTHDDDVHATNSLTYSNYMDSRQILKERELFEPHRLKFNQNFPKQS